ncbi:MAG: flagellar biosynthetic protein FliR [Candidatus Sumerlaeia bacterium]
MFSIPIEPLLVGILVMIRVAMFFAFMPVFGDIFVPIRVRMLLALAVTIIIAPLLFDVSLMFPTTVAGFVTMMLPEALLGMAFGLVGRIAFGIVQFGGNVIGEQVGFHMAQTVDPSQGQQVPVMAQTFFISALLVFFSINGHHIFFRALALSFEEAPPGHLGFSFQLHDFFREQGARMFEIAVQLALPIIAVVFMINAAMGMLAKAVPQIQVFFESFILRIVLGLFVISMIFGFLVRKMLEIFSYLQPDLENLILLLRP